LKYKIYENISNIDVSYKAIYNKSVFRAIAKISFNYLAYFYDNSVMLQEYFNVIRNFICKGEGEWHEFIKIIKTPILFEEYNKPLLGHTIAINVTNDKSMEISVSLFNSIHYKVCLCSNYNGIPIDTGCGHFFNPINHTIQPIKRSSIIPIQAISTIKIAKIPIWIPPKLIY
jgi:hypothetical protein